MNEMLGRAISVADLIILLSCYTIAVSLMTTWRQLRRAGLPTSLYVAYAISMALLGTAINIERWGCEPLLCAITKLAAAAATMGTAVAGVLEPRRLNPIITIDYELKETRDRIARLDEMLQGQ